ncbi:MAG TPA: methyltransferase domain-containing protein [Flavobacteriaceae bacterium]|nr:methyltransferase domain-containing protein [Flavobacteriaceae bacterium]HIP26766.1 methyltransferase domain-containing protein [Flavobacteriaceae bacterium]
MKIGTDGVLLGAWTSINQSPYSILDIGTGTGLIALQLAQRSSAGLIDAVEIDNNAFEQTVENFELSNWSDRLYCYHASLSEFVDEIEDKYDLIVSNPPFYTDNYKSDNDSRNKARFTDSLSFEELTKSASSLLSENGIFSVIIPFKEENKFIELAKNHNLFPNRICRVKGNIESNIKRSLMEFTFTKKEITLTSLIIEIDRHQYTEEYKSLVKDFYLKM